jgi:hypothetical protein
MAARESMLEWIVECWWGLNIFGGLRFKTWINSEPWVNSRLWPKGGIRPETNFTSGQPDQRLVFVRRDENTQPQRMFLWCASRQAVQRTKLKEAREEQDQKGRFIKWGKATYREEWWLQLYKSWRGISALRLRRKVGVRGAMLKASLLGKDGEIEKRGPTTLPGTWPNTESTGSLSWERPRGEFFNWYFSSALSYGDMTETHLVMFFIDGSVTLADHFFLKKLIFSK